MAKRGKSGAKDTPEGHPSQDKTRRFADDQRLRRHGFVIHARPEYGKPIWKRGGELFHQARALELVEDTERATRAVDEDLATK